MQGVMMYDNDDCDSDGDDDEGEDSFGKNGLC